MRVVLYPAPWTYAAGDILALNVSFQREMDVPVHSLSEQPVRFTYGLLKAGELPGQAESPDFPQRIRGEDGESVPPPRHGWKSQVYLQPFTIAAVVRGPSQSRDVKPSLVRRPLEQLPKFVCLLPVGRCSNLALGEESLFQTERFVAA